MRSLQRVVVRDGELWCDGEPFSFVLGNAYYLQDEASYGRMQLVDETLAKLSALGVRVVRTWAFNDDPNKHGLSTEAGRVGLDRVLERARSHGLRLILPLVNYWNAYGGTKQWCRDLPSPREGDPRFFTDAGVVASFAAHVEALLDRKNSISGIRYGDDETVLAWELMNEPRGDGLSEDQMVDWVTSIGRVVRSRATQLVSLGDEGHERSFAGYDEAFWRDVNGAHLFSSAQGLSFTRTLSLDVLDLASVHLYPEKWALVPGCEEEAGVAWIASHQRLAQAAGKPLVVGEFGLFNAGLDLGTRRRIYASWFHAARSCAGIGPWLFAYDARPDAWDDFSWYARSGLALDDPENRYADLVANEARARPTSR